MDLLNMRTEDFVSKTGLRGQITKYLHNACVTNTIIIFEISEIFTRMKT